MANINDLMLRYKTQTAGAIRKFISRHINEINSDGVEHAKQTSDGWIFDSEAIRIIDELRGFSQVAVVTQEESERVKELQEENENLRQLLLVAQSKLIKVQENLTENQKLLLESEKKILIAESHSKDSQSELKLEQALHNVAKQQIEQANRQLEKVTKQLEESNNQRNESNLQLEKIKNRGLFDRIFNKF